MMMDFPRLAAAVDDFLTAQTFPHWFDATSRGIGWTWCQQVLAAHFQEWRAGQQRQLVEAISQKRN